MAAGEQAGGRDGPYGLIEPLPVAEPLADVYVRSGAAGAVVDELEAPLVEHVAMRIGANRKVKLDLERAGVEAVDTRGSGAIGLGRS